MKTTQDLKQKNWYIVNDHKNVNYGQDDDVESIAKFNTEIVKPFLCDYSEAADNNTRIAIKNCHSFIRATFKLNDEQVDTADNLDLTMNLYKMLEYSDNYADTTASSYQYKQPEPSRNNAGALVDLDYNSSSFKYQSKTINRS